MVGDWTTKASEEITDAYRRFLYLKALSGETLTPPHWIDQAWHLHMTFPANYAGLQEKLGRTVAHHQKLTARERRIAWERGRALWKVEFDDAPRPATWPPLPTRSRYLSGLGIWALGIGFAAYATDVGWRWPAEDDGDALIPIIVFGSGLLGLIVALVLPRPDTISRCG